MFESAGGDFGQWLSNFASNNFGSGAANAAGIDRLGRTEMDPAQFGPPSPENITTAARGQNMANPLDPANNTTLGLTDKQWGQFSQGLGQAAKGAGSNAASVAQQQQQQLQQRAPGAAAGAGVHAGNPTAFNSLLQQVLQQRARLMPGAAAAAPTGLLGGGRG